MQTEKNIIVPVSSLTPWTKNPKKFTQGQIDRLKKQIEKFGQLDPLVVTKSGNIVIGGVTRLEALKQLGKTEVWVSYVDADTEEKMLEYAMSDNDRAGYTVDQALAELVEEVGAQNLNLDDYFVKLHEGASIAFLEEQARKALATGEDVNQNDEKLEAYLANPNKQIVLFFTDSEYEQFIERWEWFKQKNHLPDNVAAVKKLIDLDGK